MNSKKIFGGILFSFIFITNGISQLFTTSINKVSEDIVPKIKTLGIVPQQNISEIKRKIDKICEEHPDSLYEFVTNDSFADEVKSKCISLSQLDTAEFRKVKDLYRNSFYQYLWPIKVYLSIVGKPPITELTMCLKEETEWSGGYKCLKLGKLYSPKKKPCILFSKRTSDPYEKPITLLIEDKTNLLTFLKFSLSSQDTVIECFPLLIFKLTNIVEDCNFAYIIDNSGSMRFQNKNITVDSVYLYFKDSLPELICADKFFAFDTNFQELKGCNCPLGTDLSYHDKFLAKLYSKLGSSQIGYNSIKIAVFITDGVSSHRKLKNDPLNDSFVQAMRKEYSRTMKNFWESGQYLFLLPLIINPESPLSNEKTVTNWRKLWFDYLLPFSYSGNLMDMLEVLKRENLEIVATKGFTASEIKFHVKRYLLALLMRFIGKGHFLIGAMNFLTEGRENILSFEKIYDSVKVIGEKSIWPYKIPLEILKAKLITGDTYSIPLEYKGFKEKLVFCKEKINIRPELLSYFSNSPELSIKEKRGKATEALIYREVEEDKNILIPLKGISNFPLKFRISQPSYFSGLIHHDNFGLLVRQQPNVVKDFFETKITFWENKYLWGDIIVFVIIILFPFSVLTKIILDYYLVKKTKSCPAFYLIFYLIILAFLYQITPLLFKYPFILVIIMTFIIVVYIWARTGESTVKLIINILILLGGILFLLFFWGVNQTLLLVILLFLYFLAFIYFINFLIIPIFYPMKKIGANSG
jgi:hypothetical protein